MNESALKSSGVSAPSEGALEMSDRFGQMKSAAVLNGNLRS